MNYRTSKGGIFDERRCLCTEKRPIKWVSVRRGKHKLLGKAELKEKPKLLVVFETNLAALKRELTLERMLGKALEICRMPIIKKGK